MATRRRGVKTLPTLYLGASFREVSIHPLNEPPNARHSPHVATCRRDVPQKFRDRLGKSVGRQRMMLEGGHLLLVLHAPPERDHDKRQGRFFWRQPDGTWSSNQLGSGIGLCSNDLDEYNSFLDQLEEQEEQAAAQRTTSRSMITCYALLRASANLHTVLHDARKQCPDFRELIDVRDRAYTIERTAELLASGCKNGLDFQMAKQAEEQAISSHRMAIASHRLNQLAGFLSTSGDPIRFIWCQHGDWV